MSDLVRLGRPEASAVVWRWREPPPPPTRRALIRSGVGLVAAALLHRFASPVAGYVVGAIALATALLALTYHRS